MDVNLKFQKEKVKGSDREVSKVVCIVSNPVSNISFHIINK